MKKFEIRIFEAIVSLQAEKKNMLENLMNVEQELVILFSKLGLLTKNFQTKFQPEQMLINNKVHSSSVDNHKVG